MCVAECPNNGASNITHLPNAAYPNATNKLNYWDHDTDVLMGFCVPDLDTLRQKSEALFTQLYAQMDEQIGGFVKYTADARECWKLILIMGACSIGYTIVYFNNNDIKQTYPDQKIVYYFAEAKTTQTTYPDGLQVFKFSNS